MSRNVPKYVRMCSRLSNRNTMMTVIIQKLKSSSDQASSALNLSCTQTTVDHKEGVFLNLCLYLLYLLEIFVILIFVGETIFGQVYSNPDKFPTSLSTI